MIDMLLDLRNTCEVILVRGNHEEGQPVMRDRGDCRNDEGEQPMLRE